MEKPRITIYKINGEILGFCPSIQNYYIGVYPIPTIFRILEIMYLCQKDEAGNYIKGDTMKPVFTQ